MTAFLGKWELNVCFTQSPNLWKWVVGACKPPQYCTLPSILYKGWTSHSKSPYRQSDRKINDGSFDQTSCTKWNSHFEKNNWRVLGKVGFGSILQCLIETRMITAHEHSNGTVYRARMTRNANTTLLFRVSKKQQGGNSLHYTTSNSARTSRVSKINFFSRN